MTQRATSPHPALLWLALAVTLFVVYRPALHGDFIWDDQPGHVTRPELQSIAGLGRIWFDVGATQQYYPILHSAFWLEHRLWGDAVLGYHVVNVLLHATAAWLFGAVLRRLGVPGATLGAWLFALHPVCVESVAWITEQKNTLSAVFYLAAGLAYLRFEDDRRPARYVVATGWFVLALLTKTVTATLPAALLVIAWWRRGRIAWREDVQPLLPWFAGSVAGGLLTAWFESALIGAQGAEFTRSFLERGLLPAHVIGFYLGKLLWPANLTFIYPRWTIDPRAAVTWLPTFALLAALVVLWRQRRHRAALAVALLFAGTLFPVLGFLNVFPFRYSFVADHFQYLACLAPIAAAAAWLRASVSIQHRRVIGITLVTSLGVLSWCQAAMYRDVFTLYETTLARNPACWMAHNNLAEVLAAASRPAEAIPHLEAALRMKPDSAEAENNLGDDLRRLGRPLEALPHFEKALALQPRYSQARQNLGVTRLALGRTAEGKADLEAALRLQPNFPLAHFNLGLACANEGNVREAIVHFRQALALKPDYADAELNLAIGLFLSESFATAQPHFERALQLNPDSAEAHHAFGRALAKESRLDQAVSEFNAALRLNPASGDAHLNLALALRQLGRNNEANEHFAEASRLGARR